MNAGIKTAIRDKRKILKKALRDSLDIYASQIAECIDDEQSMQQYLEQIFDELEDCKYLYVLDEQGIQITANLTRDGLDGSQKGRDRSLRPYMAGMFGKTNFRLSKAYISKNTRRASLTAMQKIRDPAVSYTHLTLPTMRLRCRSRWSPYH